MISSLAVNAKKAKASVNCVGISAAHDAKLLSDIAGKCNGMYVGVKDNEHISDCMAGLISSLQTTSATGLTVSVRLSPALAAQGAAITEVLSPFPVSTPPTELNTRQVAIGRMSQGELRLREIVCLLVR
jgi:hypothetical protein